MANLNQADLYTFIFADRTAAAKETTWPTLVTDGYALGGGSLVNGCDIVAVNTGAGLTFTIALYDAVAGWTVAGDPNGTALAALTMPTSVAAERPRAIKVAIHQGFTRIAVIQDAGTLASVFIREF